jgi:hypothetical protein
MDIKRVEKIRNIYDGIKSLDGELIALEKLATKCINTSEFKMNFDVSVEIPKKKGKESVLDSDGSLKSSTTNMFNEFHYTFNWNNGETKDKSKEIHKINVNEYNAISIIGLLIDQKKKGREYLIKELEKLT